MEKISIQERSKSFAIRVIKAYTILSNRRFDDAGKILAKQFLRSGTSIGANCAEAVYAQSKPDFISKYSIAQKAAHRPGGNLPVVCDKTEASETKYWIEIMIESQLVTEHEFSLMLKEIEEIIKILASTIKSLKS
jgi:23S rRNA-intervening sequence protein